MKVTIGHDFETYGTIETSAGGLVLKPEDSIVLQNIVRHLQRRGQSDEAFLEELPRRLRNRTWARREPDDTEPVQKPGDDEGPYRMGSVFPEEE